MTDVLPEKLDVEERDTRDYTWALPAFAPAPVTMDPVTEVLERALNLIAVPERWIQADEWSTTRNPDVHRYCSIGAIHEAASLACFGVRYYGPGGILKTGGPELLNQTEALYWAAIERLARPLDDEDSDPEAENRVLNFNDEDDRTHEEVVTLFKEVLGRKGRSE